MNGWRYLWKVDLIALAITLLLILCSWYYYTQVDLSPKPSIFRTHLEHTLEMDKGNRLSMRPGFPMLTILFKDASGLGWRESLKVLLCLHIALTFWAIRYALSRLARPPYTGMALDLAALGLMLAAPVWLPFIDPHIYNFDILNRSIMLWRNTTHTALQPYAIAAFAMTCLVMRQYNEKGTVQYRQAFGAGLLLLASSLMKPSFSITFIPALGIYSLVLARRSIRAIVPSAIILLPCLIMVAAQYYIGFVSNPTGYVRGYAIAPMEVWTDNNLVPWLSLLLSILFPLTVGIARRNHLSPPFYLACINFIFAVFEYGLFKEVVTGRLQSDRNFEWSYWIDLQILFIAAMVELLCWYRDMQRNERNDRTSLAAFYLAVFFFYCHVAFGAVRLYSSVTELY